MMMMINRSYSCCFSLVCVVFLTGRGVSQLEAQTPTPLVFIEAGELPIILTAPHGGSEPIPGVPQRQGKGVELFRSTSDAFTDQLTENLADAIEAKMGRRPFVVIARFHRKYLDANRRARDAYESPEAETYHVTYHQAISNARNEVIQRWGRGVLLDIHGQAAEPKTIFRGSQNGKTTSHLVSRFGSAAQDGESSLFGLIARQGMQVIPAIGTPGPEHPDYDGGYTVITHGSGSGGAMDAIQLELGRDLRSPEANKETAKKLAQAIHDFSNAYLPQTASSSRSGSKKDLGNMVTAATGRDGARKSKSSGLRVGVYVDEGAGPSVNDLLLVLSKFDGVSVTKLKADDIRSGKLADLDLLMQPGGSGGGQGRQLGEDGRVAIRSFVHAGGGFVGICAGSYLASADYEWSLNILDAKVVDRKHWNRGKGAVDISITDSGRKLLGAEQQKLSIHYAQGPLLAPGNRPDIDDYETIATFETEIAKNGAPDGVMKGTTAIAKGKYGSGRVICFSPHPEMTNGLEHMVRLAIEHVKRDREKQK